MERSGKITKEDMKKDFYYEKLGKEFDEGKYIYKNKWLENGWVYLGLGILFLLIHFFKEGFIFSGNYFYVGVVWFIISLIVLFVGYKKK